jgi:hypothetical protein
MACFLFILSFGLDARVVVCALGRKRVQVLPSSVVSRLERDREIMAFTFCATSREIGIEINT